MLNTNKDYNKHSQSVTGFHMNVLVFIYKQHFVSDLFIQFSNKYLHNLDLAHYAPNIYL